MRRSLLIPAALLAAVAAFVSRSAADVITFTHSGTGAGSINGVSFGASAFTITAVGDTNDRTAFTGGYSIPHSSASINITGVGTFTFVTGTRTYFNDDNNTAGFSRVVGGTDLFSGPTTALLDGWNMLTSIGPVVGNTWLLQWELSPVVTSGGQLLFTADSHTGSFAAVVGSSVPDAASTFALLACGLAGLGVLRRKLRA